MFIDEHKKKIGRINFVRKSDESTAFSSGQIPYSIQSHSHP